MTCYFLSEGRDDTLSVYFNGRPSNRLIEVIEQERKRDDEMEIICFNGRTTTICLSGPSRHTKN